MDRAANQGMEMSCKIGPRKGGCIVRRVEELRQRCGWLGLVTITGKDFDGGCKDSRCIELIARFEGWNWISRFFCPNIAH